MAEPKKAPDADGGSVQFVSDGAIVAIAEEDTQPGKASPRRRAWLEKKYGRKTPPNGAADGPKEK